MQKMLSFTVGIAALALTGIASAQFDGPAPLAWRWQQSSTSAPGGSPLVVGNTIYQSLGGRVFSLDKDTGNLKWRFPAVDPLDGIFHSTPVLIDDTLIAACDNKIVAGIDPKTGDSKWTYPTPAAVYGQAIAVGKYYVSALSNNTLLALNAADGTPVWTAPYSIYDGIQGAIGVYGDDVLICTNNSKLVALNVTTRHIDWSRNFQQLPPNPTPVVLGDRIFITSGSFLIALNASTGFPIWQIDTKLQIAFPPACSASGILIVSDEGKVAIYDTDKKLITKSPIDLGTSAIARPTVVGGKFVVLTSNGGIVLLDPVTGKKIWNYVIHPVNEDAETTTSSQSGKGRGKGGGLGGPGGFGGAGGASGQSGAEKVYYIQASGPAVLAGTTLLVPAKDGSLLAFDKNLGVDLTPPTIKLAFPNAGEEVNGLPPLLLLFKVEDDDSGINKDTLKVDVDGHQLDYTTTKEGYIMVRFSSSGNNQSLPNGRHLFTLNVSDWLGNPGKKSFALVIDNLLPKVVLPGQEPGQNGRGGGFGGKGGFGGPGGGGGAGGGSGDGGR